MVIVEKLFDTDEVILNYDEGPNNGPPLLLIHGFPRWRNDFQPIIPELSETNHVYAVDLRGHGKSGRVKGQYALKDYARDVVKLLERVIKEPAVLFGHSLGGWVSLMVAAQRPEHVKALIIGDSPLNFKEFFDVLKGYSEWWITNRNHSMRAYEELREEMDSESAERLSLVDPDVFKLWIEGCEDRSAFDELFEGYDITELLRVIKCPVLLLQGNDQTLPDRDVDYAKSVLPDIIHARFNSYGHYLGLDTGDKAELMNVVSSFLSSIS